MGRLVQPAQMETVTVRRRGGGLESSGGAVQVPVGGDGFADRVAKYIPGEVLAGYMAIDRALVPNTQDFHEKKRLLESAKTGVNRLAEATTAAVPDANTMSPAFQLMLHQGKPLLILLGCLIITPLYIRQMAMNSGPATPWRTHAIIATLAFLVWAYAIQGSAFTLWPGGSTLYDGGLASALVALFTMVSGLFKPTPIGEAGNAAPARDAGGRPL